VTVPEKALKAGRVFAYSRSHLLSGDPDTAVRLLLETAAPHIRADERERIRQLAIGHANKPTWAAVVSGDQALRQFAQLIGDLS